MEEACRLLKAARTCIGTPFQLGGNSRHKGLDCIGLVVLALAEAGRPVGPLPSYRLRQASTAGFAAVIARAGLVAAQGSVRAGDILLLRPSPSQLHLAIAADEATIIHAHAGLRRVVAGPRPAGWPVLHHWRLAANGD